MARKKKTKAGHQLRLGSLNVGKSTAAVGFELARSELGLEEADQLLVGARLNVELTPNEDPDQDKLFPGADVVLTSVADVNRISLGGESYRGRFSFRLKDTDHDALLAIANREVSAVLSRIGDAGGETAETAEAA